MFSIDQYGLGTLDGFLRGISFIKSTKEVPNLSAGQFAPKAEHDWRLFFRKLFQPELDIIEYAEKSITKDDFHQEILKTISQLNLPYASDDLLKRLHVRIIEAIENIVVDESNTSLFWTAWKKLLISEIFLKFAQGGTNRYFIFQLKDKYFFILITHSSVY